MTIHACGLMYNYRFDAEQQNDGEQNENKISASECDIKDINSLLLAETPSSRARVNCNNRQTSLELFTTIESTVKRYRFHR